MILRLINWVFILIYGAAAVGIYFESATLSTVAKACAWGLVLLILQAHASILAAAYFPRGPFALAALLLNVCLFGLLAISMAVSLVAGQFIVLVLAPLIATYFFNAKEAKRLGRAILEERSGVAL